MSRRFLWTAVLAGSLLSLLVSYRTATGSIVLGSTDGRWVYEYLEGFHLRVIEVFLLAGVACGVLCAVPFDVFRRHEWWVVAGWIAAGLFVQGLLRRLTPYTLEQMFVSDGANSFYSPTLRYTAAAMLRDFASLGPTLPVHAQSNMPGKLMFVYALEQLSRRPAVLAWIVVVVSNLGGALLYVFVRDLFADNVVALVSLILYLFVPAKLFFFPVLNTVTPVVVLCCACLWLRWLQTGRSAYAALLGVAVYGLVFFEPLPLVLGLLFVPLTVRELQRRQAEPGRFLAHAVVVVAAFAVTHVVMLVGFHFNLFATFRQVSADAVRFNAVAHRPYGVWVLENLPDFLFGAGAGQALIFLAVMGAAIRRDGVLGSRAPDPIALVCAGLAAVLVATDVIGVNRGEVVRLWIFLACLFQVPAAYACARLNSRAAVILVVGTTLLQDALGTHMFGFAMP